MESDVLHPEFDGVYMCVPVVTHVNIQRTVQQQRMPID